MREIKFRAKDLLTGEWRYSRDNWLEQLFCPKLCDCTGEYPGSDKPSIDPGTVGQFTDMVDRNKREIYEGDVLIWDEDDESSVVVYDSQHALFGMQYQGGRIYGLYDCKQKELEVIGNIYDNPELLEQ